MECNKEEAFRAKIIAEKKMQDNDFLAARKFSLKAQELYPEIENITQMVCICDVHCSAQNKMFGNDMDWYGILQVEHTADDALIKKQYRKLAFLLHPDKNKFSGAESAFKLLGEAQRVLLDREKRSLYDMRRRTTYKPVVANHASKQTSKVQRNSVHNVFQDQKQQPQSGDSNEGNTFWTQCPYCGIRYQFYKEVQDRALRCQTCNKPFVAYHQATQPIPKTTQPLFPQKDSSNDDAVNQKPILDPVSQEELSTSRKARKSQKGSQSSKRANNFPQKDSSNDDAVNQKPILDPVSQEELSTSREARKSQKGSQSSKRANNFPQKDSSNHDAMNPKPILNPASQEELSKSRKARHSQKGSQSSKGANNKRGRKFTVESSESLKSDTSIDLEGLEMQFDDVGDSHSRRSSRNKRNVSYNEKNASDDDDETMCIPKRTKGSGSGEQKPSTVFNNSNGEETVVKPMKKSFEPENDSVKDSNPEKTPDSTLHEYPDPEFCDFDKDREKHRFKVGQVWAAYDTVDVMPRFYARIKRVYSRGFKLQITWLEPAPDDEDEHGLKWVESELPFPCGKFVLGDSEYTEDRLMFSHEVCLDKSSSGRDSIKIYPRKGETWALFKNWDAKWYETPENERKFEYEFVEVISEYDETVGIRVVRLDKQKGYASLYFPVGGNEVIPSTEILRFAHRVLSHRMTGNERHDIPKGSFELDLASTITNP